MKTLHGEKILIGPSSFCDIDKLPLERLCETGCEIINNPFKRKLTKPELLDLLGRGVTGLIAGLETLDREALKNSSLKVISRCGAGLSNVDLLAAKELGIKVYSTPSAPTDAVAELTVGTLIAMLRMVSQMDDDLHDGKWNKRIGVQLKGKTVAIIGFGRIGRRVSMLLKPFDVRIIAVDPNIKEDIEDISFLPLDKALREADIITIHSSGEQQLIGPREFKLIKNGAFLLNAARGELVDEDSLVRALNENRIRGVWLDTFSIEPYNGPLRKYPQVILTPHIGSYTLECRKAMEMQAVENLIQAF
jgi:D-3-phosphoglycerate dehydrogenase